MKIKRMLIISRPLAWIWTIGAFLVGIGNFNNFTLLSIIEFLFMLLPINFIVYGINDIYDIKSDKINPNKDNLQGAKIKEQEIKQIKILATIFSIAFLLISFLSFNLEHILISFLLILFAYIYSAPPIRLKSKPFLDLIFGSIGYLFPILIAFTTYDTFSNLSFKYLPLILPLIAGHTLFALRDIKYDMVGKIKSTATYLGKKKILIFAIIMNIIPIFLINDIFIRALLINSSLTTLIVLLADLKKGKYTPALLAIMTYSINLTFIYFILRANFL